jgi:hypothetical protein
MDVDGAAGIRITEAHLKSMNKYGADPWSKSETLDGKTRSGESDQKNIQGVAPLGATP